MEYGGRTIDDVEYIKCVKAGVRSALARYKAKRTDEIYSNALYAGLQAVASYELEKAGGRTIQDYVIFAASRAASATIIRTRNRFKKVLLDGDEDEPGNQIFLHNVSEEIIEDSFDLTEMHPNDIVLVTETIRLGVIPIKPGQRSAETVTTVLRARKQRLKRIYDEHNPNY